ncbi:hypothetical protein RND81_11G063600 [Saponaria officinalis]|uniref:Carnosine N-methyltransferase n=1 Tax=Saponaria officinalis TaxID=3572 RepID=A0AAW1HJL4_SAPOF
MELNDEQIRQKKMEEALEVKSLRRIISAFLKDIHGIRMGIRNKYLRFHYFFNIDMRIWSSSILSHTFLVASIYATCGSVLGRNCLSFYSLLSHLPSKYRSLRRCISANTYFLLNMLEHLECCSDTHHQHRDSSSSHNHHRTVTETVMTSSQISSCAASDGMCCSRGSTNPEVTCDMQDPSSELTVPSFDVPLVDVDKGKGGTDIWNLIGLLYTLLQNSETVLGVIIKIASRIAAADYYFTCGGSSINLQGGLYCPKNIISSLNQIVLWRKLNYKELRNIVRDWASEAQMEHDQCYQPILDELNRLFPTRSKDSPPCCLVPGAGLGRLALEISRLGFACQGNEFSYYMVICSSFILNHTNSVDEWTIYPWIHSNCNSLSDADQLRSVSIPDILPASAGITEGFSMCGGDFIEVYTDPSQEGVVNLGPLLYHFSEAYGENEMSVELSLEDVKKVALNYGFHLEKESTIETTYSTNPRSMMQNRYFAAFWTMTKKLGNKTLEKNDAE